MAIAGTGKKVLAWLEQSLISRVDLAHRFESCQEQNFFIYKSNKMSTLS